MTDCNLVVTKSLAVAKRIPSGEEVKIPSLPYRKTMIEGKHWPNSNSINTLGFAK